MEMGDRRWAGKPPRYVTSHLVQLNLLSSSGQEMNTGQNVMILCGWGLKAEWLISFVDKGVVIRYNCDPSLTGMNLPECLRDEYRNELFCVL